MSEAEMLIIKEGTPTSDNVEAGANIFMQNIKPALGGVTLLMHLQLIKLFSLKNH